jgi:hypothetical protein
MTSINIRRIKITIQTPDIGNIQDPGEGNSCSSSGVCNKIYV